MKDSRTRQIKREVLTDALQRMRDRCRDWRDGRGIDAWAGDPDIGQAYEIISKMLDELGDSTIQAEVEGVAA